MTATILIIISIACIILLVAGIFLPSTITFERNLSISAESKKVFACIDRLKHWEVWSAWSKQNDATIVCTYPGKHSGLGAVMQWKGKKLGSGRMEIIEHQPNRHLEIQLIFNNSGFRILYIFNLAETGSDTHVQWKATCKMRRIGIAKFIALMLPRWMGRDMQIGLTLLKQYAEQQ